MEALYKPVRAWRILFTRDCVYYGSDGSFVDGFWVPNVQRETILAQSPEEAIAMAKVNLVLRVTGYNGRDYEPTITCVKPFVRLGSL